MKRLPRTVNRKKLIREISGLRAGILVFIGPEAIFSNQDVNDNLN